MMVAGLTWNEPFPGSIFAGWGITPVDAAAAGSAHKARAAIFIAALVRCIILEPCRTLDTLPHRHRRQRFDGLHLEAGSQVVLRAILIERSRLLLIQRIVLER